MGTIDAIHSRPGTRPDTPSTAHKHGRTPASGREDRALPPSPSSDEDEMDIRSDESAVPTIRRQLPSSATRPLPLRARGRVIETEDEEEGYDEDQDGSDDENDEDEGDGYEESPRRTAARRSSPRALHPSRKVDVHLSDWYEMEQPSSPSRKRRLSGPKPAPKRAKPTYREDLSASEPESASDAYTQDEEQAQEDEEDDDEDVEAEEPVEPLRRSTRHRIKPLEWWRGERAVYGSPRKGEAVGPTLKAVHRVERAEGEGTFTGLHFTSAHKAAKRAARRLPTPPRTSSVEHSQDEGDGDQASARYRKDDELVEEGPDHIHFEREVEVSPAEDVYDRPHSEEVSPGPELEPERVYESEHEPQPGPDAEYEEDGDFIELDPTADNVAVEDGWDESTERMQRVWDPDLGREVDRPIACTSSQMHPRVLPGADFAFEKLLSVDDTLASGVLYIPVGKKKETKSSKENNYVFFVIQGAVRAHVSQSEFIMSPGGLFVVPRGNQYSIENISQREVRLMFTQTRNWAGPASAALRASVPPRLRGTPAPAPGTSAAVHRLASFSAFPFTPSRGRHL